jgi:hypothetical protein
VQKSKVEGRFSTQLVRVGSGQRSAVLLTGWPGPLTGEERFRLQRVRPSESGPTSQASKAQREKTAGIKVPNQAGSHPWTCMRFDSKSPEADRTNHKSSLCDYNRLAHAEAQSDLYHTQSDL